MSEIRREERLDLHRQKCSLVGVRGLFLRVEFAVCLLLVVGVAGVVFAQSQEGEEPEVEFFFSSPRVVKIGVMGFIGTKGVTQETADVLADLIAEEICRLGDVKVVTKADIQSMLDLEKKKRLAGCTDEECFAEISGALGMRWMITGNVSLFGGTYLLNL